jgi:hypothetical protein
VFSLCVLFARNRRQNLHCHITTNFRVACAVYFTHSTRAELRTGFVASQFCTRVQSHPQLIAITPAVS